MLKRSKWFGATLTPKHEGYYEIRLDRSGHREMRYWNGNIWQVHKSGKESHWAARGSAPGWRGFDLPDNTGEYVPIYVPEA